MGPKAPTPPTRPSRTGSVEIWARPAMKRGRMTLSADVTTATPQTAKNNAAAQRPCTASTTAAGAHTSDAPTSGTSEADRGQAPEHEGRRQANEGEGDPDERALDDCRQQRAQHHRPGDGGEMLDEVRLPLRIQRDQQQHLLHHHLAVPQEEKEEEERHGQPTTAPRAPTKNDPLIEASSCSRLFAPSSIPP